MPNLSELLYYTGETSLQLIVWSMFIGVVIATIAGYLIKAKFGAFIRKLLENEIDSPEKAVTLDELGLQKKIFIKFGLRSQTNYRNMLVAITEDGRFYANNAYTEKAPAFKEFIVVKRKRGSDVIKEAPSETQDEAAPLSGLAKVLQTKEKLAAEKAAAETEKEAQSDLTDAKNSEIDAKSAEATPSTDDISIKSSDDFSTENNETSSDTAASDVESSNSVKYSEMPKERVKFDITKARYYIPPEIHDRAYSLYHTKSSKMNTMIPIIVLLIILALIATFSGNLISGFTGLLKDIKNPFSKPTI